MNKELAVISAVYQDDDVSALANVKAELFPAYGDVQAFVLEYYTKHKGLPPKHLVEEKFAVTLIDDVGATRHHIEELQNLHLNRKIREILREASTKVQNGEITAALNSMLSAGSTLKRDAVNIRDLNATDVDEAIEHILRIQELNARGKYGVTFGIPGIDDFLPSGMVPGMFGLILGYPGRGKLEPLDTKFLTPTGWKRNGDLVVGDKVIGKSGRPTTVVALHPQGVKDIYRVTFNDDSWVDCGLEHNWTVQSRKMRQGSGNWTVKTTGELMNDRLSYDSKTHHRNKPMWKWFIPVVEPVVFDEKALPLEPYTLGILLGDGSLTQMTAHFTTNDSFVYDEVTNRNPDLIVNKLATKKPAADRYSILKLMPTVRSMNLDVLSHDKFIPEEYFFGSVQQRIDLLRGLMDSDGSVRPNHRAMFHSCNERLAQDVQRLVWSLGGVARISKKPRKNKSDEYEVFIWTPDNPFLLPRKASDYSPKPWFRAIKSIEWVGEAEAQCITVDADDHCYVTKDYVVTHNSFLTTLMAVRAWDNGRKPLYVSLEMTESEVRARVYAIAGEGRWSLRKLQRGEISTDEFREWAEKRFEDKEEFPIISNDGSGRFTPAALRSKIEEYNPSIVFVDYLQLMAPDSGNDGNETVKLKSISTELKIVAMSAQVPVIGVVSATPSDASDVNSIPELMQVAWAKQLAYDADWVLAVGREDNSPIMGVAWRKNRNGPLTDWMLDCNFDKGIFTYDELDFDNDV